MEIGKNKYGILLPVSKQKVKEAFEIVETLGNKDIQ